MAGGQPSSAPPSTYSVGDFFDKIVHLLKWWKQSVSQTFGQNGERGIDFSMPFNQAVGSITAGQVIYAGRPPDAMAPGHTSIGNVVQIRTPDNRVLHYQHLWTVNVQTGQNVNVGTVLGTSGGCAQGSIPGYCIPDKDSNGPHIEVREAPYSPKTSLWNYPWENPVPYINKVTGGSVNAASGTGTNTTAPNVFQAIGQSIPRPDWLGPIHDLGVNWGEHIAIFLLALLMIALGLYLIAQKQVEAVAGKAVEAGKVAVAA